MSKTNFFQINKYNNFIFKDKEQNHSFLLLNKYRIDKIKLIIFKVKNLLKI